MHARLKVEVVIVETALLCEYQSLPKPFTGSVKILTISALGALDQMDMLDIELSPKIHCLRSTMFEFLLEL